MQDPEITRSIVIFLLGTAALLPLLFLAVFLWRRYYRDDPGNTARRVVKNSAVPGVIRILIRTMDMAFALVLYRFLLADEVGQYDFAIVLVVQYFATIADFGLGTLLTREVARRPDDAAKYFSNTLLLRWGLSLLMVPAALLLIGSYDGLSTLVEGSQPLSGDGATAILILCLTLFPAAYNNVVTALFNARERMEIPAAVELVTQILSVFARVAAVLLGFGVIGLAWAAVLTTTLTSLILLILQIRVLFRPRLQWDWPFAKGLFRPAFPLLLNSILVNIAFTFDIFILRAVADAEAIAQYRMPYRFINVVLILTPLLTNAIFPIMSRYAEQDRQAFQRAYRLTMQMLLLAAFPIAVGATVLATDIVVFFTGAESVGYTGTSDYALAILIWFLPLSYVNGVIQYVLIALNRQQAITRAFIVMAVFNLLANLIAIPIFGIFGASVVTVLTEVVLYLAFLPLLRREQVVPPLLALSWRPALAAMVMGGAMILVYPVGWVLAAVVAPLVYALVLWALGAFGEEERALVLRVLGRS
ncbi:MAG: oligosaccharide flippase family protein [Chloroflexota bacterium]